MDDSARQRIREVAVFGALKPETLEFLLARATRIEARAGEALVRENDPGGDLYVIESGRAEVVKERHTPRYVRLQLAELGPGDCFGEASMLACMPRSASVIALTDCRTLRIRNGTVLALHKHDVSEFAILIMNLGREAARRLWVANELLVDHLLGASS